MMILKKLTTVYFKIDNHTLTIEPPAALVGGFLLVVNYGY